MVGGGTTGQVRLGWGLCHAREGNRTWKGLCLLLIWTSWTWLFGGARHWMSLSWRLRLRRGLCLGCRLSQICFGCMRRRVYLLLTLGAWCGHVHPQSSLHLTVKTQPLLHLCEVRVGVKATLVAHHGVALCAGVDVVIPSAHQVSGFADGAQFAAGHGCNLRHRVGGGGDTASVGGHRRRPPSPVATHIHL